MSTSPAEIIAALEQSCNRFETPCGDGTMAWRRWGSGRPLVLLHGGSGSWKHWVRNIDPLARNRQVWAPDLPGFGDSALPHGTVDFTSISSATIAGLQALLPGESELDICGFSFGAHTSQYVADGLGGRVGTLVLVNGHIMGPLTALPNTMLERWRDVTDREARREIFRRNLAALMLADPANIDELAMTIYEADVPRARVRPPKFLNSRDMTILGRLKCRVASIAGEHDPLAHPSLAEQQARFRQMRPEAQAHTITGAGHWVAYEAPDRFDALLARIIG